MGELPRHSVSVTGIVFRDDGRVLAIQRSDDGRWVPPGGVLELSETPADGVAREARQVAWLTVEEATRDMVEARAVRITDALSGNGPFVRAHDGIRLL